MTNKGGNAGVEIEESDAEETEDLPGDHHGEADVQEEAFEQL
jgi:hypothetical protein